MKANTPELMKFKRLQRRLNESRRGIAGLLELLWIGVSRNCPEGDVGRFTNEEIAIMVDWEGDPDLLVNALVDCGWLDVCDENRLVVHDWLDHCPTYVKGGMATRKKATPKNAATSTEPEAIAVGQNSSATSLEPEAIAIGSEPVSTKPSLTKPNQAFSIQAEETKIPWLQNQSERFRSSWDRWKRHLKQKMIVQTDMEEETELMDLVRCYPNEDERIVVIDFSIGCRAKHLVKNGDHRKSNSPATKPKEKTFYPRPSKREVAS